MTAPAARLGVVGLLTILTVSGARAQDTDPDQLARGAEIFSRQCQRCHNPRGPAEWTDRDWVIIIQHMQTRANLTRERARLVRAFLLASSGPAGRPGRERVGLPGAPDTLSLEPEMINVGREAFQGRGGCAACHSADLRGGPIAPNLRNDTWRTGTGSLADILSVIRNGVDGTAMAPYPGGIDDDTALATAAYVWSVNRGRAEP